MPDAKQILITVKKPDGTLAKVSMAEFKAMQGKKAEVKHQHQAHKTAEHHLKHLKHVHTVEHRNARATDNPHHARQIRKMTREDTSSPLEEKPLPPTSEVPVLKNKKPVPMRLPTVDTEELPALATPFNSFIHSPNVIMDEARKVVTQFIRQDARDEQVLKLNSQPVVKKFVNDITEPLAEEFGPVEEIKSATLTDFRRLSDKPEEAARRLKQKMFNLQDESFVLYLEALSAYRSSSLYLEYMQVVCEALANRKSLAIQAGEKNGIKLEEISALIEMEKEL
ncbi:MAG: hypothetical protein AAB348_00470 [Patescibacteria group bacterium]